MIITRGFGENNVIITRGSSEILGTIKSWVDSKHWASRKRKYLRGWLNNRLAGGLKQRIYGDWR